MLSNIIQCSAKTFNLVGIKAASCYILNFQERRVAYRSRSQSFHWDKLAATCGYGCGVVKLASYRSEKSSRECCQSEHRNGKKVSNKEIKCLQKFFFSCTISLQTWDELRNAHIFFHISIFITKIVQWYIYSTVWMFWEWFYFFLSIEIQFYLLANMKILYHFAHFQEIRSPRFFHIHAQLPFCSNSSEKVSKNEGISIVWYVFLPSTYFYIESHEDWPLKISSCCTYEFFEPSFLSRIFI